MEPQSEDTTEARIQAYVAVEVRRWEVRTRPARIAFLASSVGLAVSSLWGGVAQIGWVPARPGFVVWAANALVLVACGWFSWRSELRWSSGPRSRRFLGLTLGGMLLFLVANTMIVLKTRDHLAAVALVLQALFVAAWAVAVVVHKPPRVRIPRA